MALFIDCTDRLLIPSWREFGKSQTELAPIGRHMHPIVKGDIQSYLTEWRGNRNLVTAGELITAAIVNGQTEDPEVRVAAKFVVDYPLRVPVALTNVSKDILSIPLSLDIDPTVQFPIYAKIAQLKKLLILYPTTAVYHIEIARQYMLLGQLDRAEEHINNALYFDCNNRFVVRSAARFFIHRENEDMAIDVLRKSGLTKKDPWLMASEISVSRHYDRRSPNLKRAIDLIDSKNFSNFDLSELCGTIGMEEYESGAYKKSRKLFNQSLTAANDNSFAQAQWMAKNRQLDLIFPNAPINTSFKEALSYEKFFAGEFNSALQYAIQWQDEVPYSLKCAMFGSGISTTFKKDYKTSIRLLSTYLQTNQRSKAALNDLAYAYALNNDTVNAQIKIDLAAKEIDRNNYELVDICIVATQGLILFREGFVEEGTKCYEIAVESSRRLPDKDMLHSAILNYTRELLLHSNTTDTREKVVSLLGEVPEKPNDSANAVMREEVEKMLREGESPKIEGTTEKE